MYSAICSDTENDKERRKSGTETFQFYCLQMALNFKNYCQVDFVGMCNQ